MLIAAFKKAVDGEHRWGARMDPDIVQDLNGRWVLVIKLIEELCRKKPKK